MVAGVHGNMGAAQKHVEGDNRMEEEPAQIQLRNMEEIPVQAYPLILGVVISRGVQVCYTYMLIP